MIVDLIGAESRRVSGGVEWLARPASCPKRTALCQHPQPEDVPDAARRSPLVVVLLSLPSDPEATAHC
jgi:hypothetical protein